MAGISLDLAEFRTANVARCESSFFALDRWDPMQWGCALSGEVGELCNVLKKLNRADGSATLQDAAYEAADVVAYLDLLCARMGIDLALATIEKWNRVSVKRGYAGRILLRFQQGGANGEGPA